MHTFLMSIIAMWNVTALSNIQIRVRVSIPSDVNHYTTGASIIIGTTNRRKKRKKKEKKKNI